MKKLIYVIIAVMVVGAMLQGCGSKEEIADDTAPAEVVSVSDSESGTDVSDSAITEEMAYEGVSNYCHSEYDWSIAEDDPSIMSLEMGEETESEYQVVFRSYTGAFVYFYVDKTSGTTRIVEYAPALDVEEETGTIDLFDYLEK